jgi:hypothetical protein
MKLTASGLQINFKQSAETDLLSVDQNQVCCVLKVGLTQGGFDDGSANICFARFIHAPARTIQMAHVK